MAGNSQTILIVGKGSDFRCTMVINAIAPLWGIERTEDPIAHLSKKADHIIGVVLVMTDDSIVSKAKVFLGKLDSYLLTPEKVIIVSAKSQGLNKGFHISDPSNTEAIKAMVQDMKEKANKM